MFFQYATSDSYSLVDRSLSKQGKSWPLGSKVGFSSLWCFLSDFLHFFSLTYVCVLSPMEQQLEDDCLKKENMFNTFLWTVIYTTVRGPRIFHEIQFLLDWEMLVCLYLPHIYGSNIKYQRLLGTWTGYLNLHPLFISFLFILALFKVNRFLSLTQILHSFAL